MNERTKRSFYVANLSLVEQCEAPLSCLVTEWLTEDDDAACSPVGEMDGAADAASRSLSSFSIDELCATRAAALSRLLRFARDQVTQLSGLLARVEQELLLTDESDALAAARLRPDGIWEVRCAKCKSVVRFSKTALNIACENCRRPLARDARSMHEAGERSKSQVVCCLSDLPAVFADRVVPDTFLSTFIQRGDDEFSEPTARRDSSGRYASIASHQLPGKRHPSRQSALTALRETVQSRLTSLAKQRARIARLIA